MPSKCENGASRSVDRPDGWLAGTDIRLICIQQLLQIWNKAKGKERNALLWGDEVCLYPSPALVHIPTLGATSV